MAHDKNFVTVPLIVIAESVGTIAEAQSVLSVI